MRKKSKNAIVPPLCETELIPKYKAADKKFPELGIAGMLGIASKIGPKRRVRQFSIPRAGTCFALVNGIMIATSVCRARCYVPKMEEGRPQLAVRWQKNFAISQLPWFPYIVAGAIHHLKTQVVKIHAGGEFYGSEYILAWRIVADLCPGVSFLTYTRAWRQPDWVSALTRLASAPNVSLILSADRSTGWPPPMPDARVCWLADNDADVPPSPCLVVFRSTVERKTEHVVQIGGTVVCPHQNGAASGPPDCVTCRLCLFSPAPSADSRDGTQYVNVVTSLSREVDSE